MTKNNANIKHTKLKSMPKIGTPEYKELERLVRQIQKKLSKLDPPTKENTSYANEHFL